MHDRESIIPRTALSPSRSVPAAGGPMFLAQMHLLPNCLLICRVAFSSRCSHLGIWRPTSVYKQQIASLFCFWSGPDGAPPCPWMIFPNWPEPEFSDPHFSSLSLSFNHLKWSQKLCTCLVPLDFSSFAFFLSLLMLLLNSSSKRSTWWKTPCLPHQMG